MLSHAETPRPLWRLDSLGVLRAFYEKGSVVKARRGGPAFPLSPVVPIPLFYSHSDEQRQGARCMLGSESSGWRCQLCDALRRGKARIAVTRDEEYRDRHGEDTLSS